MNLDTLKQNLGNLTPKDRGFAESLLASVQRRNGPPSDKQAYWIDELAKRATGEAKPRPAPVDLGNLQGMLALFDNATRSKLRNPAIVLHIVELGEIRLSMAGASAKVPGSINVATNEGFSDRTWFGRILRTGSFEPSPRRAVPEGLVPALQAFAAEPAKMAADHGRRTGRCCFCALPLTDERSTHVGYGKRCSQRWGLEWGARPDASCFTAEAVA